MGYENIQLVSRSDQISIRSIEPKMNTLFRRKVRMRWTDLILACPCGTTRDTNTGQYDNFFFKTSFLF